MKGIDLKILKEALRFTDLNNAMLLGPHPSTEADLERLFKDGFLQRKEYSKPSSFKYAYVISEKGRRRLALEESL